MGRQCLYHTAEEKLAANRAKSKQHYDKVKNSINKRRQRKYQKANQKRVECLSANLAPEMNIQTRPIDTWLKHATRIQARFNRLIENNPIAYLESICTRYLADHNKDAIQDQTILLAKLQKSIYKCHSEVLQLSGVGDELSRVENVEKVIRTTVSWVEEVFCYAIVDWIEVRRLYHERSFLYQNS
ncbi:hypothetical protein BYT27DRAFT_7104073 [Phlegmacium glaucopus]|nr:hypothetical protein BYT27DRAFT_7104073 [Phlegmacium glaucopus]